MIGKTISHYTILEKIGEGGMGEVYRAEDLKLKRQVAIKFLPSRITIDEKERARFLQEAQATAAINHPHVCVIYEIQDDGYPPFIVLEYVEGQTLHKKITTSFSPPSREKGSGIPLTGDLMDGEYIPMPTTIEYAIQICEALKTAHENCIIHRDIKSDNIMITANNQIKVMDFGLAKLKGSLTMTQSTSTVGTLAYMSPEQIEGREIDTRSDIFSFGVVLYEMLSGKLPFQGAYESALIYSILNEQPEPIQKIRSCIPSELIHVLNRSLEKNPEERYQRVDDLLIDLKRIKKDCQKMAVESIAPAVPETIRTKLFTLIRLAVVLIILLTIMGLIYIFNRMSDTHENPLIAIPFTSLTGHEIYPEFSPDGSRIAFSWNGENQNRYDIYLKSIGSESLFRLTNLPGGVWSPEWSPDGKQIAFCRVSEGKRGIYIVTVTGDSVWQLHKGNWEELYKLSWSPDNQYIAISGRLSTQELPSIYLLSVKQQVLEKLTSPPIQFFGDYNGSFSPDGKMIAFNRDVSAETGDIYILSITGGEPKQLTFDNSMISGLSWTQNGGEIVFSSNRNSTVGLWRVPVKGGKARPVSVNGQYIESPAIARCGNHLAYVEYAYNRNIYRIAIPKSEGERIIPEKFIASNQSDFQSEFSPDGSRIAFISFRSGSREIWACDSAGQNPHILVALGGAISSAVRWSPDGSRIVFDNRPEGHADIFIADSAGELQHRITAGVSDDILPCWSKDGAWIYFTSNRSGEFQIWKISTSGDNLNQLTSSGGYGPHISADGKWIYYTRSESVSPIYKIPATGGDEILAGNIRVYWYDWCLGKNEIYYVNRKQGRTAIEFLDLRDNRSVHIADVDIRGWSFLNISTDNKYLLYSHVDYSDSDIMLVENFQ